jgi:hypothetical protein
VTFNDPDGFFGQLRNLRLKRGLLWRMKSPNTFRAQGRMINHGCMGRASSFGGSLGPLCCGDRRFHLVGLRRQELGSNTNGREFGRRQKALLTPTRRF